MKTHLAFQEASDTDDCSVMADHTEAGFGTFFSVFWGEGRMWRS